MARSCRPSSTSRPTCGHCEYVITEVLPGLFDENGGEYVVTYDESILPDQPAFYLMSNGQLQLLMVDTSTEAGSYMFGEDTERLGMDRPACHASTSAKRTTSWARVTSPRSSPGWSQEGLAGGRPGLATGSGHRHRPSPRSSRTAACPIRSEPRRQRGNRATSEPATRTRRVAVTGRSVGGTTGWTDRFGDDLAGNSVSVVVLVLLLISAIAAPMLAIRGSLPSVPGWLVIVLALVGVGVAAYLANVETTGNEAVCGPVGDCNAVQESEYAELFGIPIGVLGADRLRGHRRTLGRSRAWPRARSRTSALVLIGVGAWIGTLFSVYLTFLEPFVIGATCMWCITSALVMMALLWISAGPAYDAWNRLRGEPLEQAQAGA